MKENLADYCNWAILRKWQTGETEFYDQISAGIRSEFEIFRKEPRLYY